MRFFLSPADSRTCVKTTHHFYTAFIHIIIYVYVPRGLTIILVHATIRSIYRFKTKVVHIIIADYNYI